MKSGGRITAEIERELRVDEDERDADADERHEVHERVDETVLQQLRERVDVGGHAGHDAARHLLLVVVDAEPLEMGEHLDPQRVQEPFGGAAHRRAAPPTSPTSR